MPVRLVYADGPDGPLIDPATVAGVAGVADPEVVLGWVVRAPAWLARTDVPVTTLLVGPGTRRAVGEGRIRAVGARLSATPELLSGPLRPAVAVVAAVEEGRGFRFRGSVGLAPDIARNADAVVVERWPAPLPYPTPPVEGRIVGVIDREEPPDPPQAPQFGPPERQIGRSVAGLIPDGATVQWGPGTIGAAVVASIERPVQVHSGLVTEELALLAERGLLDGVAISAYMWGGPSLDELAARGSLALRPVRETHDLSAVAAIERFVAVNTALEVGLDGAVNVEEVRGRRVAGPGGHPDFCVAATRSRRGLSVVALRSTVGGRSTIVPRPAVVSTPRSDVGVVVTEHGVADLRGADDRERATRLIAVAAPQYRAELEAAAGDR
ncbi:MAG: hypothetical protein J2P57_03365 [Acidimicrobiaceae bacterium]|nr:hypothetical protein [Acidimicrobiaceae bacterium]